MSDRSPRVSATHRSAISPAVVRRRRQVAVGLLTLLLVAVLAVLAVTLGGDDDPDDAPTGGTAAPTTTSTGTGPATATASATRTPTVPTAPTTSAATTRSPSAAPTAMKVVEQASGVLATVRGSAPAPGDGPVLTVRIEVEKGVDVVPAQFAGQVMATLNDPRSWGRGGERTFARTSGDADVVVVLASPVTSAGLCRPLVTRGRLSCSIGERAILTSYRWARGTPEFDSLAQYRDYVVNHEVGHALGRGHQQCGGAGELAPVMQQQTKQVAPCRPNSWPFP